MATRLLVPERDDSAAGQVRSEYTRYSPHPSTPTPPGRSAADVPNHTQEAPAFMTVNLHAKTDFQKGDLGRVAGHVVVRVETPLAGEQYVVALQEVSAGSHGWFEKK